MSDEISLLHLPVELLWHIAHLSKPKSRFRLMRVCRYLSNVVTPVAFHHIVFSDSHHLLTDILGFFWTISNRENLARIVRHITIHFIDPWEPEPQAQDLEVLQTARTIAESHGLSEDIQLGIMKGVPGAMAFLLFPYLPNLHSLAIDPMMSPNIFSQAIRDAPLSAGLSSLRSVHLLHSKISPWNAISPFFRFLNLSAVYFTDMRKPWIDIDHLVELPEGSLGLERIHVENSHIDDALLTMLIKSSRGLSSLTLRHNSEAVLEIATPSPLGDALRKTSLLTLQDLTIDLEHELPRGFSLGSFLGFFQLKHITCPISMLLEASDQLGTILPRSLVSLTLRIDSAPVNDGWSDSLA